MNVESELDEEAAGEGAPILSESASGSGEAKTTLLESVAPFTINQDEDDSDDDDLGGYMLGGLALPNWVATLWGQVLAGSVVGGIAFIGILIVLTNDSSPGNDTDAGSENAASAYQGAQSGYAASDAGVRARSAGSGEDTGSNVEFRQDALPADVNDATDPGPASPSAAKRDKSGGLDDTGDGAGGSDVTGGADDANRVATTLDRSGNATDADDTDSDTTDGTDRDDGNNVSATTSRTGNTSPPTTPLTPPTSGAPTTSGGTVRSTTTTRPVINTDPPTTRGTTTTVRSTTRPTTTTTTRLTTTTKPSTSTSAPDTTTTTVIADAQLILAPSSGSTVSVDFAPSFKASAGAGEYCWAVTQFGSETSLGCTTSSTFKPDTDSFKLGAAVISVRSDDGAGQIRNDAVGVTFITSKLIRAPREGSQFRKTITVNTGNHTTVDSYCFRLFQSGTVDTGFACSASQKLSFSRSDANLAGLVEGPATVEAYVTRNGARWLDDSVNINVTAPSRGP